MSHASRARELQALRLHSFRPARHTYDICHAYAGSTCNSNDIGTCCDHTCKSKGATCDAARYLTKGNPEGTRCSAGADNCSNDGTDCCTQRAQCKTDPNFCSTVSTAAVAEGGYVSIDAQQNTYCAGQACDKNGADATTCCKVKQCVCASHPALAATGAECPVDGNNFCLTCPDGFSKTVLGQNTQTCEAKVCRCTHGARVEGNINNGTQVCNNAGDHMCVATGCDAGYEFQPESNTCAEKEKEQEVLLNETVTQNATPVATAKKTDDDEGVAAAESVSYISLPKLIVCGVGLGVLGTQSCKHVWVWEGRSCTLSRDEVLPRTTKKSVLHDQRRNRTSCCPLLVQKEAEPEFSCGIGNIKEVLQINL